ncbi:hypothetical protein FWG95_04120 [Candidatus Saccharibacteria bacterium]|nr:hypothetical protein [Candidatus Saccharibacteria bacterium]
MGSRENEKIAHKKKFFIIAIPTIAVLIISGVAALILVLINQPTTNDDSVKVGQKTKIYIGSQNSSIGTSWQVKSVSNQDILSDIEIYTVQDKGCPPDATGCYSDAYLIFAGARAGQSTIVVEQCFRGDCTDAQTKSFDITVR